MSVSQNNNRLFLAILLGIFMASGCSGHSVKYGANSEGEGMGSEEEMNGSVAGAPLMVELLMPTALPFMEEWWMAITRISNLARECQRIMGK